MSRLIQRDEQGNWCLKDVPWDSIGPGVTITRDVWEKFYGALCKLKDYEETELSPERVFELNDFVGSQTAKLLAELREEREKHRWIPVSEQLPEDNISVLVQVSGKPQDNITFVNSLQIAELDSESGWIIYGWPEWECVEPDAGMPLPELYRSME